MAAAYERAGKPADFPSLTTFDSFDTARTTLVEAIGLGDLEQVDATTSWIVEAATSDQIMTLAGPTLDLLGAAGHAWIASSSPADSRTPAVPRCGSSDRHCESSPAKPTFA